MKAFLRGKQAQERPGKDEDPPPRRYAPDTLRLIRAALSVVLSEAIEDGLIEANPCLYRGGRRSKAGTVSKADRPEIRPMSSAERGRFLEAARSTSLAVLFELLVKTGLRPSEAYALRLEDLDLRTAALRVERSLSLHTREIKSTKTAETRMVDLSPELVERLRGHLTVLRARAMKKGWGEPERLFPSKTNTHLDHNTSRSVSRRR